MAATLPATLAALRQLARLPLLPCSRQPALLKSVAAAPIGRLMLLAEGSAGSRLLDMVERCLVRLVVVRPRACPACLPVVTREHMCAEGCWPAKRGGRQACERDGARFGHVQHDHVSRVPRRERLSASSAHNVCRLLAGVLATLASPWRWRRWLGGCSRCPQRPGASSATAERARARARCV